MHKEGRLIEDTPKNFAFLVCELLDLVWYHYPRLNLFLDRHFSAPSQIATVDTTLYRHLPVQGILAVNHVDSQRNLLVQLADFAAGSIYDFHKRQAMDYQLIKDKVKTTHKTWRHIKAEWIAKE